MNGVLRIGTRRSVGWSAVLLLHALVLMAALGAGSPTSANRASGHDAPRSVMVLLRAAVPSAAARQTEQTPRRSLPPPLYGKGSAPAVVSTQAAEQAPVFAAATAEPAAAPLVAAPQRLFAVAQAAEPAAQPAPAPASFARPDHAQCPHANYPMPLRERGIEGTVLLRVRVDADGRAADVHLLQASGWRLFDEAALQAVRACRFVPARRDGAALASWVEFPVRFALAG